MSRSDKRGCACHTVAGLLHDMVLSLVTRHLSRLRGFKLAIKVTDAHLGAIRQHGERTYPYECCGFLLGTMQDDLNVLAEVYPAENEWAESIRNVETLG